MSHEEIRLAVGTLLQLELTSMHLKVREPAKVIGYLEPISLLVTTPKDKGALIPVRDNDDIAVRYMDGEYVCGFKTAVIRICREPFSYLHLYYPAAIERVRIRNAERISTEMSVTIKLGSAEGIAVEDVMMKDLSASGARVFSRSELGPLGARLAIEANITFAGLKENLVFDAIIRNVAETNEPQGKIHQYGVQFMDLSQQCTVFIQGYIYECMISARKR